MEKLKSASLWLLGLFTAVFGMFLYERNKKQQAEAKISTSEDQLLQYKQTQEQGNIQKIQQNIDELEKQHSNSKPQELTPEQSEQYWKDKK